MVVNVEWSLASVLKRITKISGSPDRIVFKFDLLGSVEHSPHFFY